MTLAALIVLALIAAALVAVIVRLERGRAGVVDAITAAHARALDHADERRREAEQRAGAAESDVLELGRQLDTSGYRRYLNRHVVVQCRDGRALRGVLVATYEDSHVLEHPTIVETDQALGGEMLLPDGDVASMQYFSEAEAA